MTASKPLVTDDRSKWDFKDEIVYLTETKRGLSRETVAEISEIKGEPAWMRDFRLKAYDHFLTRPMPTWGGALDRIDFDKIVYYRKPSEREEKSWDDVPAQIKQTFERLGIPEAERKFLAGVGAQYDSEVVYHKIREDLEDGGRRRAALAAGDKEDAQRARAVFRDLRTVGVLLTVTVMAELLRAAIPLSATDPSYATTSSLTAGVALTLSLVLVGMIGAFPFHHRLVRIFESLPIVGSLIVGVCTAIVALAFGIGFGLSAGYLRWLDGVLRQIQNELFDLGFIAPVVLIP